MIITQQKDFDELRRILNGRRRVFLVGCGECASLCETGGEAEVEIMKKKLEESGFVVTGSVVVNAPCHELDTQRELRQKSKQLDESEAILSLSCGAGLQSISESVNIPVFSACDTLFLGNAQRRGQFFEKCSLCGHCTADKFGGICPVTRCAKGLMNGPCGGARNGMCEVDDDKECAWTLIFKRLAELGEAERVREYVEPDAGKIAGPGKRVVERKKQGTAKSS